MTAGTSEVAALRGRPRDQDRHEAVLVATRDALVDVGYSAMSYSDIAARAGVTRQLLYRWWPAKASLVSEAIFGAGVPALPTRYDGPLERDARRLVQAIVDFSRRPDVRSGVAGLMADADADTPLPGLAEGLLAPLHGSLVALIDAGVARGEVRDDVDVDLTLGTFRGAVTMHLLVDRTPPTRLVDHLGELLALVLARRDD